MNQPKELIKQWINAINHLDVEKVLSLYAKSAILIPTFSNRILNSPDKLRNYFERLVNREGLSVTLHENTLSTQSLHNDKYILSGIYNWQFEVDKEMLNFESHFTFLVDLSKINPIIHHHSSQIPRML